MRPVSGERALWNLPGGWASGVGVPSLCTQAWPPPVREGFLSLGPGPESDLGQSPPLPRLGFQKQPEVLGQAADLGEPHRETLGPGGQGRLSEMSRGAEGPSTTSSGNSMEPCCPVCCTRVPRRLSWLSGAPLSLLSLLHNHFCSPHLRGHRAGLLLVRTLVLSTCRVSGTGCWTHEVLWGSPWP